MKLRGIRVSQVSWVGAIQKAGAIGAKIMMLRSQNGSMGDREDRAAVFGSKEEKMSENIKIWRGHFWL